MKKLFLFFFLAGIFSTSIYSQQLYLCKSYTDDGEPIDADLVWEIKPWGTELYILYNNGDRIFSQSMLYLFIDKFKEGKYEAFDSKVINVEPNAKWTAYNYKFNEPGSYDIYITNSNQQRLAERRFTIKLEGDYISTRRITNARYYDRSRLIFCERVIAGQAINVFRGSSLSKNNGKVFIFVTNPQPLNTEIFLVDVWRKPKNSFDYTEYIESKKYALKPGWANAFFQYKFKEAGDYKFSVYNDQEVLINSGFISVSK